MPSRSNGAERGGFLPAVQEVYYLAILWRVLLHLSLCSTCILVELDWVNPMTQVARWYERKFDFSFPLELYPDLCVRLRGTPARLEEMMRGCAAGRRVRAPEGKWSAQEHAGHLVELEPLWMARVEDFVSGRDQLSVADLSNRSTFEARHNERAVDQILADFRTARLALVDRVDGIDKSQFGRTLLHPRLKVPMRLVDHLFFVAEHDDHHLAIICEMIRE
jgi:uncharacterized damage-inducible protein DinB